MHSRRSSTLSVEGVTGGARKSHRTIPLTLFLQSFLILSIFVVVLSNVLLLLRFVNSQSSQVSNNIASQRAASCGIDLDDAAQHVKNAAAAVLAQMSATSGLIMPQLEPGTMLMVLAGSSRAGGAGITYCDVRNGLTRYDSVNRSCYIVSSGANSTRRQLICGANATTEDIPPADTNSTSCQVLSLRTNQTLFERSTNSSTTMIITSVAANNDSTVAVSRTYDMTSSMTSANGAAVSVFCIIATTNNVQPIASNAVNLAEATSVLVASIMLRVNSSIRVEVQIDNGVLESRVTYGTKLLILVSATIGVGVAVAGALFVHLIVRGLVRLSDDMRKVGSLQVDDVKERRSIFSELDDIGRSLTSMAKSVRLIRDALPSDTPPHVGIKERHEQHEGDCGDDDDGALMSLQKTLGVHMVRVHVSYESRASSKTLSSAVFDFGFGEDDMSLFERLCTECKVNCNQDEFDPVTVMYVSRRNEHELLRNSVHLLEILSTRPSDIRIVMYRAVSARFGVVLTSFFDVVNVFSTVAFVARLAINNVDTTSLSTFCALYACALCLNAGLTVWLLRSTDSNEFVAWARKSHAEIAWCIFFSTLNMQNIELVWTGMRVRVWDRCLLRFNAPVVESLLQRSISWSMFGFMFSDVAQLMYKVWQVYGSGSHVEFTYVFALATSGLSVAFNLMFKFHAILLWSSQRTDAGGSGTSDEAAGDLIMKEVSLMLVHGSVGGHVVQLNLRSVEWNEFYSEVLAMCRRARAVPLTMCDGKVLVGFNVHRRCPDHQREAIQAALRLSDNLSRRGHACTIALASGSYNVGVLGSLHHKCLHVIGPVAALSSLCAAALLSGQRLVIASQMAEALGVDASALAAASAGSVTTTDFVFSSNRLLVLRPRTLFGGCSDLLKIGFYELESFFVAFLDREDVPSGDFRLRQLAAAIGLKSLERDRLQERVQRVVKYLARPEETVPLDMSDNIVLSTRRVLHNVLELE